MILLEDYVPALKQGAQILLRNLSTSAITSSASKTIAPVSLSTGADFYTDGIHDEVEIQAAIDALSTGGGGIVFLRRGTYSIASDINVKSNVSLVGEGLATTLKAANGSRANGVTVQNQTNVVIKDIQVDGNRTNVDTTGPQYITINGIYLYNSTKVRVEGCYVHDAYYGGIEIDTCTDVLIRGNYCYNNRDNAIFGRPANVRVIVQGNVVTGSTYSGIQFLHSDYIDIIGNLSYSNGPAISGEGDGIGFEGCRYSQIVGNIVHSNGVQGIKVDYTVEGGTQRSAYITVADNTVSNQTATGSPGMEILRCDYLNIVNNLVYNNYYGINIGDCAEVHVSGNKVNTHTSVGIRAYNNSAVGPVVIENNHVVGSGASGIEIQVNGSIIRGNTLMGNAQEGVRLQYGAVYYVMNNLIKDNSDNGVFVANNVSYAFVKDNIFDNTSNAQQRAVYEESSGAGPTYMSGNLINSQANTAFQFQNTSSLFTADRTQEREVSSGASVTLNYNDYYCHVNKGTGSATTVTLPAGVKGLEFIIVDKKGDAGTNNITVTPNGSEKINGAGTNVINTNYGKVRIRFNGSGWNVL